MSFPSDSTRQHPQAETPKKKQSTDYMVLGLAEGLYYEIGVYAGANDLAAIKAALAEGGDHQYDGYVAVPARSFRVRKPSTETKTITRFA